ncbi:MAG: hypothetical protein ACREYF_22005 [Gammaproteobacteria bacterium]
MAVGYTQFRRRDVQPTDGIGGKGRLKYRVSRNRRYSATAQQRCWWRDTTAVDAYTYNHIVCIGARHEDHHHIDDELLLEAQKITHIKEKTAPESDLYRVLRERLPGTAVISKYTVARRWSRSLSIG